MPANTTVPNHISRLRGQFDAFERSNPIVNDLYRFCDAVTKRDTSYFNEPDEPAGKWLISKPFDLLFVCGLAPWILGVVAYSCTSGVLQAPNANPQQQLLTFLLVGASFLIGESHQFTSILRYYSRTFRQRRNPYFWQRVPIWLLYGLSALMALAVFNSSIVAPIAPLLSVIALVGVSFFPVVLMQHFCAQAKAVGLIYCNNNKFYVSDLERLALSVVAWLLVVTGALTIAAPFNNSTTVPLAFGEGFNSIAIMVTRYAVVFMGIHFVMRGMKNNEWLPAGAALTWINIALFVLIPVNWMLYVWLFVPVFFHASQHWVIAWSTLKRDKHDARVRIIERRWTHSTGARGRSALRGLSESKQSRQWSELSQSKGEAQRKVVQNFLEWREATEGKGLHPIESIEQDELDFLQERPADRTASEQIVLEDLRRLIVPVQICSVVVLFGTLLWQNFWTWQFMKIAAPAPELTLGALLSILLFYCHYLTDRVVWRPTN